MADNKFFSSPSVDIIESSTKIIGDIFSEADFRIDGVVEGNITTTGKVVVGKSGKINGKINCSNADISGSISGKIDNMSDDFENLMKDKEFTKSIRDLTIGLSKFLNEIYP